MNKIRRNNHKYPLWKKRNDAKIMKNKLSNRHQSNYTIHEKKNFKKIQEYKMPSDFSIRQNPEETIEKFNAILNKIKSINTIHTEKMEFVIVINMQDVKNITEDALMYLVTIVKNGRLRARKKTILWKVGLPSDEKLKVYLQKTGFVNFFEQH